MRDIRYSTIKKVLDFIKENQPIYTSKLATHGKIDYNSAKRALQILYEEGKIEYVGKNINKQIKLKNENTKKQNI